MPETVVTGLVVAPGVLVPGNGLVPGPVPVLAGDMTTPPEP
jgi:hypothetical protein